MSKTRKLTLALCLVGGGYLAALVLGGLSDSLLPPAPATVTAAPDCSWFSKLTPWRTRENRSIDIGQLVPVAADKSDVARSARALTETTSHQPTWLSIANESSPDAGRASEPAPAEPPKLVTSSPLEARQISLSSRTSHSLAPQARITEVRPMPAATMPAAAPWDRWPRLSTQPEGVQAASVPATFQDHSVISTQALQASYHESEVIRKNTPPRDSGTATARALRTHVVIDGDTLARLAGRYLDDAQRAPEIYRLNCDVLSNPDLLPIGVELRIPLRERTDHALASLDSTASVVAAQPGGGNELVPVPWLQKPRDEVPRAQLLQPVVADLDD